MGIMNLSAIDEQVMFDVLSVPTVSQHEHLLVEFLMDFAKKYDVDASLDDKAMSILRKVWLLMVSSFLVSVLIWTQCKTSN